MMQTETNDKIVADEDRLRADLYNFLGLILARPPEQFLLDQTAGLNGDVGELGQAINGLARVAKVSKPRMIEAEFTKLFIGLGRGELLPYASYYLTGFLHEKPLALLRQDMIALGLERAPNVYEPEDNIASLMEMMGALIIGRFGQPARLNQQKEFFGRHIKPWAGHFFLDLESAKNSVLYASVGLVGRVFMDIEAENFRLGSDQA